MASMSLRKAGTRETEMSFLYTASSGDGLGDVLAQLPQVLQLLLALAHHPSSTQPCSTQCSKVASASLATSSVVASNSGGA